MIDRIGLLSRSWSTAKTRSLRSRPIGAAFDPAKMLGPHSPLLPEDMGRRVAVYRCSCGEAGCGVIAPVIVASPDGTRISWVDFRDYVGVFIGPVEESVDRHEPSASMADPRQ